MKITISENNLKQIVTESVKKVLNEISSDLANKAAQHASDRRNNAVGTPEWGKRNRQMNSFNKYYGDAYNKEHGYDGQTEMGGTGSLQFNDTLSDGSPLRVFVMHNAIKLTSKYFDIATSINKLISMPQYQERFCILSPKTAQQVAKWLTQNRYPKSQENEAVCNPEFWTKYYNNSYNNNVFSKFDNY